MYYAKYEKEGKILSLVTYSNKPKFSESDIQEGWVEISKSDYETCLKTLSKAHEEGEE